MQSETVVRTAVCPLETSERKNDKLRRGTEQFSEAARTAAAILPSFPEHTWRRNNTQIYRATKRELGEYDIKDKVVQNAVKRVVANFRSTRELGSGVPNNGIDDCNFVLLTNQGYEIASNDRGYGFRGNFIPFKPEWWHMDIGQHQRQYLERGLDGDGRLGQVELAYNDGNPLARVAVSWEQAVTEYADAEYVVGVDIGYRDLCAVAVREKATGDVVDVEVHTGGEFREKRKGGNGAYTDTRLHEVAKDVVALASEWSPCVIRLEDMTDYRTIEREAIHDWPFNDLQSKIEAKATAAGIGVESVEPHYTSQTCRKCGHRDEANRDGSAFECLACGYEVNADVNAAMNIAASEA